MWFSYHSGTIFEHFGCWNIRCYLGAVLEGFWGGFSEGFGRRKLDFGPLKRSPILKPKLEAEKVIFGTREGGWPEGLAALITIVDQSIIDNVDRRSMKSLIVGR